MENEKKMNYGLQKTKCKVVMTGKKREEIVEENVKAGTAQNIETY